MAERKPVLLRIPRDLWESLSRWARDDLRSLNAQIEFVLREAVRRRAGRRGAAPGEAARGHAASDPDESPTDIR